MFNKLIACLMLVVMLGCGGVSRLTVNQSVSRTEEIVKQKPELFERYEQVKAMKEQAYQIVMILYFTGVLEEKDVEKLKQIDTIDYYLSVAYKALIESDEDEFDASMKLAEVVVEEVMKYLMEKHAKEIEKNSI